ncbi:MAG: DUF881 domain-containing protein [Romboutsia sp.]
MKIKIPYKSVIICSIVLGIFISLQLKAINLENKGMTTSKKGNELALELKGLKKEEEEIKLEIEGLKESIHKYKDIDGESAIKSELKKYEELAGFTDVEGKGIEVRIKSNEENIQSSEASSSIIYNYDLLLSMINKLNSAQANAISINGERIISNSYINLKEDKLYINDIQVTEPFIIKAIGDCETLSSALQIKYGIIWEMEKYYNVKTELEKKQQIKINGYSKNIKINHSFDDE